MARHALKLFVVIAIALSAFAVSPVQNTSVVAQLFGTSTAHAQEKRSTRSLLSILFGRNNAKKKAVKSRKKARPIKRRSKKSTATRKKPRAKKSRARRSTSRSSTKKATVASAAAVVVEKSEDAKKVLVIGDFFAGGLADGLEDAYEDVANVVVVDKSNGLSGFVRDDVVNWPVKLKSLLEEEKPAYILAMLGSNDRQLMRDNGKKLKRGTPEWNEAYARRILTLAEVLKGSGVPYTWIGLPSVRFKTMNTDFLEFNELYRKASVSPLGKFVDVWDGFADADGNFTRSGPDVNGQIVLLRPKDGINLTNAGRQRLAFYVQADVLKSLGGASGPSIAGRNPTVEFGSITAEVDRYDPARSGKTIVIRLDDPAADGDQDLAGAGMAGDTLADKEVAGQSSKRISPVVRDAGSSFAQQGRVDNYAWPPQTPSVTTRVPQLAGTGPTTVQQ